jgi:hypothetical protein
MEATCNRCHQGIPAESCYCPTCGLPQIVYSSEDAAQPAAADRWSGTVKDAGSVEWKPALRVVFLLAVPAGLLSCAGTPSIFLSPIWMAAAAGWAVTLYMRQQRPAWITMWAGARIGLVTGLLAGWFAFVASCASLYAIRNVFGEGKALDEQWQAQAAQLSQQSQAMSVDATSAAMSKWFIGLMLSAEGRAGLILFLLLMFEAAFVVFAAAGGALGARLTARPRQPAA